MMLARHQTVNLFDGAGRPLEITSPSGRKQNLTYNFLGNITQVQFKNSGGTVTETQTMTYDAYGRETATSSSQYAASTAKSYNDRGQLATEATTYSGQTYTVTYHYDAQGRPSKLTYPSGREAEYTYDNRQLLKTIKWETVQIEDRSYNDAGMLTGVDRAFVDETRTYNAGSQLTQINNTNVGSQTYTYDLNGNVTSESLSGVMANYSFSTIHAGGPFADGYDAEDRFMRFKRSGVTEDILLTRSNIGNISNVNRNGTNTARGYNTAHGLTTMSGGTTQTYDTDGNTTTLHTNVTAVWDDAGRMKNTNVPAGATAGIQGLNENGYVGGNRIWKKITRSGSVVEHRVHIHAGPNLIAEYNSGVAASTPVQEYVYGGEIDSLVLIRRSDATKYGVTRNRQWSITALHDLANGTIVERYAYEMTGKRTIYAANGTTVRTTSSYGNNFGYTSRWHDEDSGLMYFRARYYNPLTGEFLSRDPVEFVDGMSLYRGYMGANGTDPGGTKVYIFGWEGAGAALPHPIKMGPNVLEDVYKPLALGVLGDQAVITIDRQHQLEPLKIYHTAMEIIDIARSAEQDNYCQMCFPRIVLIGFSWGAATAAKVFATIQLMDPEIRVDLVFTIDPVLGNPLTSKEFHTISGFKLGPLGILPIPVDVAPTNFCNWSNYYQNMSLSPPFKGDSFPFANPNIEITKDDILGGPYNPGLVVHAKSHLFAHAYIPFLKTIQDDWEALLRPFKNDPSKESYRSCQPCQHELRR